MTQYSPEDIEELMEGLSYAFSQPAADAFRHYTRAGKKAKAIKLVVEEGFSKEDATAIYEHFYKELMGCPIVGWRAITAEEAIELGTESVVQLLIRRGGSVFVYEFARCEFNGVVEYPIYHDHERIDIREVDQIWIGDKKQ